MGPLKSKRSLSLYLPLTSRASDCLAVYDVTKFIDEVYHLLSSTVMRLTHPAASWRR